MCLNEGVGHEAAHHGLESLSLDGEEDPVDGDMVPGYAGPGGVSPTVDRHTAGNVARGHRITVLLYNVYMDNSEKVRLAVWQIWSIKEQIRYPSAKNENPARMFSNSIINNAIVFS